MSDERAPADRPSGIPDSKSEARRKDDTPSRRSLRPGELGAPATPEARPPGLPHMTTSVRRRLQLVLEDDEPRADPPTQPPNIAADERAARGFEQGELRTARSLARWIAFSGLMTLTVSALTGFSYLTGAGTVAHVVVGILSGALGVWLGLAALSFRRVASPSKQRPEHHLISAFGLLRSALLLKAVLLFAALALGCVTFSLAASLLFLL